MALALALRLLRPSNRIWSQGSPSLTHSHGLTLQALVILQLWANLDVLLVASWQELSQHVCTFTKALAQRPFKCVTSTPDGGCGWEGDKCQESGASLA